MKNIERKDCMVQAVISATGRKTEERRLRRLRQQQMEQASRKLNPQAEARNLKQLLGGGEIETRSVSSIRELERLGKEGNVFVGFSQGIDTPPHIAHLGRRRGRGFQSNQQFTSDEQLIDDTPVTLNWELNYEGIEIVKYDLYVENNIEDISNQNRNLL